MDVYVCMHACTYVHVCTVRMYVCTYVCMYVRMYVCMYVCMYVRMYVCMYVCSLPSLPASELTACSDPVSFSLAVKPSKQLSSGIAPEV